MNKNDIRDLLDYHDWANRRILDTAERLTPEQLAAPTNASFGNLHATLVHLLDTDWGWLVALKTSEWNEAMKPEDFPTLAALRQRWDEEDATRWAYFDTLTDADLQRILRYEVEGGIVRERVYWHVFFHIVNHGMQHRSEAAAMLTDFGQSPGDIDFTVFLNERAGQPSNLS